MSTPNRTKLLTALGAAGLRDFNNGRELELSKELFELMNKDKPVRKRRKKSEQTLFES